MKSARYIATKLIEKEEEWECSTRDYRIPLWKRMWHLNIPAKTKIFTWKACMNGLLTFINLQKKKELQLMKYACAVEESLRLFHIPWLVVT